MHGDFTGGIGSMAWLGLASAAVGGWGGGGWPPPPYADFPMYVSVTVCSVCVGCCCLLQYMLPYAFRRCLEMHGDFRG